MSAVGDWNPAWGPKPEWQGRARPAPSKYLIRFFACPRGCHGGEVVKVYGRERHYTCVCGTPMVRVYRPRRRQAPKVAPGDRYGRLVITEVGPAGDEGRRATCRCDCGTVKEVWVKHLRDGSTRSCGCLHHEAMREHPWRGSWK